MLFNSKKKKFFISPVFVISIFLFDCARAQPNVDINHFISSLDSIRTKLKIPGMAAAVMENDSILFAKGFGYTDLQNQIKTTENTSFGVASVTKTFTSTLIMQLVEQGKLDLNAPVSKYGVDFGNQQITVRNLLTHTSEGKPGTYYQYNGYRYGRLGPIIEMASGKPFYQLLMENIVEPLGMTSTAPRISLFDYFIYMRQKKDVGKFFENAFSHAAKAYELNAKGQIVETTYLNEFGAFGGLVTNVKDLLKYSRAIDRHQFVNAQTQQLIFTPNHTSNGAVTPYGLGWFVQNYRGIDFYWHYGQTQGESALFLKVPSHKLTFVVMANTDKLSQPFPLGDGDLFMSPLGQLFYKYFINQHKNFLLVDYDKPMDSLKSLFSKTDDNEFKEFYNKEIITHAVMDMVSGDSSKSIQLFQLYADMNFRNLPGLPNAPVITAIKNVSINQEISENFSIAIQTHIRVYGVGENCSGDYSSWCDYGWIEDSGGKMVWQMQSQPARHAGGAKKNQLVDTVIDLPAGSYKLRYKSDAGHAFNSWDSAPPDNFFWGIVLFKAGK